jgi:hypothetical protein
LTEKAAGATQVFRDHLHQASLAAQALDLPVPRRIQVGGYCPPGRAGQGTAGVSSAARQEDHRQRARGPPSFC